MTVAASDFPLATKHFSGHKNIIPGRDNANLRDILNYLYLATGAGGSQADLIFDAATELTIAGGIITATQAAHTVDTQADAGTDDLDSILGGTAEELIVIRPANGARDIVLKHAIGANLIACPGAQNITLAEVTDFALLYNDGTQWVVLAFSTLALTGGGLGLALSSTANGQGASRIAIEDPGFLIAAVDVEGALVENRALLDAAAVQKWSMGVFGTWGIDVDAAATNGAGLVGADPLLTTETASFAKIEDGGVFASLAASAGEPGYTAAFQLFPDVPVAAVDMAYLGSGVPFCEMAFASIATPAVYNSTDVLEWEYSQGGSSWAALTIAYDGSEATAKDGTESWERDGAISFVPPADWAADMVDGAAAYWVRAKIAAGKAANMTTVPVLADEQATVTPADGFIAPATGTVTDIRLNDAAAVLHTTADVKFILMNYTSGAHSGELTFAQVKRTDAWSGLTLAVTAGDVLGVLVTQEDGAAEPANVLLEMTVSVTG